MTHLLLCRGADPSARRRGGSPLHHALHLDRAPIVQVRLRLRVSVRVRIRIRVRVRLALDRGEGDDLYAAHWGGLPEGDLLHLVRGRGYGLRVRD